MKKSIVLIAIVLLTVNCAKQNVPTDAIPTHTSFTIASKFVNETRVINVWLPPSYENTDLKFPVLYMPDGGIKEDFPHIANTLAKLIKAAKIEPIILVGIENTVRGRDLTGASNVAAHEKYKIPMSDGAKDFRNFITKELFLKINTEYKTSQKKGLIGESLSGLFVMETFFLAPTSFNFYIAMDPSFWWNDNFLVKNADSLLNNLPSENTSLWFAGSDAVDILKYTQQLANKLEEKKLTNLTWLYSEEKKEQHNTIFRATKEKALIWTLNSFKE